jgi:hypothetical protein
VFCDINDRLPPHVRVLLDKVTPSEEEYKNPDIAHAAFEAMHAVLQSHLEECFLDGTRGHCALHGKQCQFYEVKAGPGQISLMIAGHTCVDFSKMGARLGFCGPSIRPFLVFVYERRVRLEDLIITECTEDFPHSVWVIFLGDIYEIHCIVLGPENFGFWCDRRRKFTILIKKSALAFVGSMSEFTRMFFRSRPEVDEFGMACEKGDMFFCAPASALDREANELAEALSVVIPAGTATNWERLLAPGNRVRHEAYIDRLSEGMLGVDGDAVDEPSYHGIMQSMIGPCLWDTGQTLGQKGSWMHPGLGTLITHGSIWSARKARIMLGLEHLVAQGVPAFDHLSCDKECPFPCPFKDILPQMKSSSLKHLAGNAIHIAVIGHLTTYMIASCIPRSEITLEPSPSGPGSFLDSRGNMSDPEDDTGDESCS